jgi:hypothetical protein
MGFVIGPRLIAPPPPQKTKTRRRCFLLSRGLYLYRLYCSPIAGHVLCCCRVLQTWFCRFLFYFIRCASTSRRDVGKKNGALRLFSPQKKTRLTYFYTTPAENVNVNSIPVMHKTHFTLLAGACGCWSFLRIVWLAASKDTQVSSQEDGVGRT